MSHLVLARKSRPTSFDEVVGQDAVVKTLKNSILRERIAHALLFSGVRGVGKTTLARLMARAINCEAEPAERPCNSCRSCRDIAEGRSLDIIEIDGASNNGVDNVRDLRENVKVLPSSSRCRVVIIDEIHMLSISAFNALLKTLEEPPAHVHFMFATTEIHKVPITILSRCQQYELKKVPAKELSAHFARLTADEGFTIEDDALAIIVRESGGSVRDGLSLLEQLFSFGGKQITAADVVEMLGLAGQEVLLQLTRALVDGDRTSALTALNLVFEFGVDLRRFVDDLLEIFRTLLLLSMRGCEDLVAVVDSERDQYAALARTCTTETIHLKLSRLLAAAEAVQHSAQPRLTLEIAILNIIEAGNVVPLSTLLGQLGRILPELDELGELTSRTVPAEVPAEGAKSQPPGDENTRGKKPEPPAEEASPPAAPETAPQPAAAKPPADSPESSNTPPPPCSTLIDRWQEYAADVEREIEWIGALLQRADEVRALPADGDELCRLEIHYDDAASCSLLMQPANLKILERHAVDFFGRAITVSIETDEKDSNSDENSPKVLRRRLANDPKVRLTTEIFLGEVSEIRLKQKGHR